MKRPSSNYQEEYRSRPDRAKGDKRVLVLFLLCITILSSTGIDFFLRDEADTGKKPFIYVYDGQNLIVLNNKTAGDPIAGWNDNTMPVYPAGLPPRTNLPPIMSILFQYPFPINLASSEELQLLPGVGPKLGAAIFEYREQHGPITSPKELLHIRGVGPENLKRLSAVIDLNQ